MKNVVVVGGGTGSFVILKGLKKYPLSLSAVVSMMDSGGSTGRLRDQYGVVPPGDARQCLVALSESSELWRKLFLYRFGTGDFQGHNFGNIFLTVLEKITDNYQEVIDTASYILQVKGRVLPVTFDKVHLCVKYEDGEVIETEELIDTAFHKTSNIEKAYLKPTAHATKDVIKAIKKAEFIVIGPGDLYTSLIPNLVVGGVADSILNSKAKIIAIVNLMTKRGQTTDYKVSDHLRDLEHYMGRKVNIVFINNEPIPERFLNFYKRHGEKPVEDDIKNDRTIIRLDLLGEEIYNKDKSDMVMRSLLRHDSEKISAALWKIIR